MKVAFYVADQNPKRDRSLGITGYTDGLLHSLSDFKDLDLITIGSRTSYTPDIAGVEIQRLPWPTDRALGRLAADNFHLTFGQVDPDIWHYPKGHLPLAGRPRKPVVGTVHDLIAQHCADHFPQARSALAYRYWLWVLKRSIPRLDLVLTISKFSEASIRQFCDRYGLRCPPIIVSYEGVSLESGLMAPEKKRNKVVHLSSLESYKRTSTVLEFWKRLQTVEKDLPFLKLIGPLLDDDRKVAETISGVELSGRLPRRELETEIAEARALLFFSEIEGFGLPAVEAYLLGTPALYVEGTAVEEIVGRGTPGGFDLASFGSFKEALDEVLRMGSDIIAEKAAQLRRRFDWRDCAVATRGAYAFILNR